MLRRERALHVLRNKEVQRRSRTCSGAAERAAAQQAAMMQQAVVAKYPCYYDTCWTPYTSHECFLAQRANSGASLSWTKPPQCHVQAHGAHSCDNRQATTPDRHDPGGPRHVCSGSAHQAPERVAATLGAVARARSMTASAETMSVLRSMAISVGANRGMLTRRGKW